MTLVSENLASITPVILCGGAGTRLWPASNDECPKQFMRRGDALSMFQQTVRRVRDAGLAPPVVVTTRDLLAHATSQLAEIGLPDTRIVTEPVRRNTGPAICAAATLLASDGPDAPLLFLPSDHLLTDLSAWRQALGVAICAAQSDTIVAFGILPDRAETGFGYIETAGHPTAAVTPILQFIEKPDAAGARAMLASGRYLWNAGMFLARATVLQKSFLRFAPGIAVPVERALRCAQWHGVRFDLGPAYGDADNLSFDHAVMEAAGGPVVPLSAGWKDLGTWRSLWEAAAQQTGGTVLDGNCQAQDCTNTLLCNERADIPLVGVGLRNIAAIATDQAILITDLQSGSPVPGMQADVCTKYIQNTYKIHTCRKPWGSYEILAQGPGYQVKRLTVDPGGCLSLQSHLHRSENWVVASGVARVTLAGHRRIIKEKQHVHIARGAVHRLENPGAKPLHLIEVQTGAYLGEDDITRFEDIYARV